MLEKLRIPDELFSYKLGCVLKLEDMLDRLQAQAA